MADRLFASEGDSRNVGRPVSPTWGDRWDGGRPRPPADDGEDAPVGVARRLQGRLDRHLWLLERMQSDPLQAEPPGLPELMDTARRMRRDAESLLLLCGQGPDRDGGSPRRLSDVLEQVAAVAEEPRRVDVRPAPAASLTAAAATELVHVLAELVDHVTAVYPGARVDLACRVEAPAGIVVEVRADGAARHDPDGLGGRAAMAAAERLAFRSRSGIALRRSSGRADSDGSGSVATVHCPGAVVTLEQPERPPMTWAADRSRHDALRGADGPPHNGNGDSNGTGPGNGAGPSNGNGGPPQASSLPVPPPLLPPARGPAPPMPSSSMMLPLAPPHPSAPPTMPPPPVPGPSRPPPSLLPLPPAPLLPPGPSLPPSPPPARPVVDELFGPLIDLDYEPSDDDFSTPIFEAIASAWFREDAPESHRDALGSDSLGQDSLGQDPFGGGPSDRRPQGWDPLVRGPLGGDPPGRDPLDWESPSDSEWRAAAARAARPDPAQLTLSGLPRRRPGDQLVPPLRSHAASPQQEPAERVPDRVRDRLSTYQRGLRQGRHRAPQEPGDADAW